MPTLKVLIRLHECTGWSKPLLEMTKVSAITRVAMVREKYLENGIFSRSGKSQGILWKAREIQKGLRKSGKSQEIIKKMAMAGNYQKIYLFCSRGKRMYILMIV